MPPEKDIKPSTTTQNTSARIQQIFAEVQSQLPTVNFDTDDPNDELDNTNNEALESTMPENTDALLESLSNRNTYSFLTVHPRIDTPQHPPSVESQMRLSPNPIDTSITHSDSPPKSSLLSMDLFNTIDFDKLPTIIPNLPPSATIPNLTPTFQRSRQNPTLSRHMSSEETKHSKTRDDRQILERLAHQATQIGGNDRSFSSQSQHPLENLQSALSNSLNASFQRFGQRTGIPESERRTIYIDLRHSQPAKKEEQSSSVQINPITEQKQLSESESEDENSNDGMLWFEKRRLAKQQQQQQATKK